MPSNAFLLDAAAKATMLLAAGWLVTLALRRHAAAARYFTWICALGAALAVPVISALAPRWNVQLPATATVAAAPALAGAEPVSDIGATAPINARRPIAWMALIWLAGALIALMRIALGNVRLAMALRRAPEIRVPEWIAARDAAAKAIGLRHAVTLRRSSESDVPLTGGLFSLSVALPESCDEWDEARRRVVLLHELTHARRRDPLVWLLARIAVAAYWFHPLAWLAAGGLRREQERSCDDAVLRAGTVQSDYAQHLVDLARSAMNAATYPAALGMAATSDLEDRVHALLDTRARRDSPSRRACSIAAAALIAVIVPLAAVHAQESPATSLSGTVYDASGAVVPNVLVLLKSGANHQEAARASAAGEYSFSGVPAGSYTLQVRAPGFAEFQKTVVLPAGQLNITLDLGQVTEALEVVGKGPRPKESGTPHRIRVGGNVQATKLVSMTKPVYPPVAQAAGVEGTVMLRAVISTSGDLLGLSVLNQSVDPELASAAMDAVKQWHYQPTLLNGEPVEVVTTIAVTFRLEK